MCNRCNCSCGNSQNAYDSYGSRQQRCNSNNRCGCQNAWQEAEILMMEQQRRRCYEDRCAREFVRCMQCHNY